MAEAEAGAAERRSTWRDRHAELPPFEPCKLFLEAGIPVICDKPLVNTSAEARELVRLADRNGTFFAVTYTYTGYPMVRDARARVRAARSATSR